MSQYISSFLIDPVVRQARRFSRPAHESPHLDPLPSVPDNEAASPLDVSAEAASDEHEAFPPLSLSVSRLPASTVTGDHEVQSPNALNELENEELQAWEDVHSPSDSTSLQIVLADVTEPDVNAQRHPLGATEGTSQDPRHGVHDDLRSTTSSFSNSARSVIDATMSSAGSSASMSSARDHRSRGDSGGSGSVEGALPADDGMSHMRKKIIAIQRNDSSNEVKARLVHGLMTEKHTSSQQNLLAPRAQSPGSIHSSDRPFTPSSPKSVDSLRQTVSPPTSSSSNTDPTNHFNLLPDDLKPTYYQHPYPPARDGEQDEDSMDAEEESKALGCQHYKRNIKLQCSACHRWYTCRFCHDAVEDHMLNRRETKNMLCMLCGCAQPASEDCALCGQQGAWYYCDVCKLWDDSPEKSIYHCNDCGICRLGEGLGKDFFHCKVSCNSP